MGVGHKGGDGTLRHEGLIPLKLSVCKEKKGFIVAACHLSDCAFGGWERSECRVIRAGTVSLPGSQTAVNYHMCVSRGL